jgi:ferritin-like metal-binding protein YciE
MSLFTSDRLDNLQELYVEELRDTYSAETQILQALPKMAEAASNPQLKSGFEEHLRQTQDHVQRLEQIFQKLDKKPEGKTCKGMQGLLKEGNEMIKERADEAVRDAGLISAAQRVEHYEMAAYGTVRTYAHLLGREDEAQLLQQTLDEEGQTDKKLTYLAESMVNEAAAMA